MQYSTTTFLALAALAPTTLAGYVGSRQALTFGPAADPLPPNAALGTPALTPHAAWPKPPARPASNGDGKPVLNAFFTDAFVNVGNINMKFLTIDAMNAVKNAAPGLTLDTTYGSQHQSCQFDVKTPDLNLRVQIKGVWNSANSNERTALTDAVWQVIQDIESKGPPYPVYEGCCPIRSAESLCDITVPNPICLNGSCSCQGKLNAVCKSRSAGRYLPSNIHVGIYSPNGDATAAQVDVSFSSTEKDGGKPGCGLAAEIGKEIGTEFLPVGVKNVFSLGMGLLCDA